VVIGLLAGAATGLAAAPVVRAAVVRHAVPYGEPPGTGSRPGLGRVAVVAAGAGAALGSAAQWPLVLVLGWVGLFGVVLAFVDVAVFRLPDALTLPLGLGTAALLLLAEHRGEVLLRCLYGALVLGAVYGALALVAPMGLGDVKLAPTLGAVLGWYGWSTVLSGFFLGFLLAGLWGGFQLLTRRTAAGGELPFGPWMLLGALLAVLAAG